MTEIPKMNLVMEVPLKDADTGEIIGTAVLKATDAMGVYLAEMHVRGEKDRSEQTPSMEVEAPRLGHREE